MQGRTVLSGMDLKAYLGRLRQNPKYNEDILRLIEDDLRFGLSKEEIEEYSSGRYDYRQMCVYSRALRSGYSREEKALLLREGLSGEQMAVALEFYEKGVPLDTIAGVLSSGENTAYTMKRLFSQVLSRIKEAKSVSEQDLGYARELADQIQKAVEKISYQEKRYDALNEKLKEIGIASQDAQIQNNLLSQLTEKDGLLEKQKNELNEARTTIARLRGKIEETEKEKKGLEEQIKQADSGETDASAGLETPKKNNLPDVSTVYASGSEARTAVEEEHGRTSRDISLERTERKDRRCRMRSVFLRLFFKKRKDIVKLLADKNLSPEQLVQIRSAIEKGLSEKQLLVLINSKIPAEQMEEIIGIAVYENQMREVQAWD